MNLTNISTAVALMLCCNLTGFAQSNSVSGNGNLTTKTVNTKPYNSVKVSGSMEVLLEKGAEGNISVTAEENVQDYIVVESDGEVLTIKLKNNTSLYNVKKIKITVPFTELNGLSLRGSGKIESDVKIKTDGFSADLSGSGDISVPVAAETINAKMNGSGTLKLSGSAAHVQINLIGSGDFLAKDLVSKNIEANVTGSGEMEINASNSLNANVQGSGKIVYDGNPITNNSKVIGSGSIKAM